MNRYGIVHGELLLLALRFYEKENQMAVLKNKTQGQYTMVSQRIMKDKSLSLTERGMLLTLLSLPDNWHLTIAGLSQILPDGKEKIAKTLNSLIEKGYVTREQNRGDRGQFDSTNLEVHETPVLTSHSDPDNDYGEKEHQQTTSSSPCPENPDTVNRDTDNPQPENQPQYNTNISNNHRVCVTDTLTDSEYDDLVSEFGKDNVDYHINRIKDRGYKGCYNFNTIKAWCKERLNRPGTMQNNPAKKNSFCNFKQRDYDFDELERLLVCN